MDEPKASRRIAITFPPATLRGWAYWFIVFGLLMSWIRPWTAQKWASRDGTCGGIAFHPLLWPTTIDLSWEHRSGRVWYRAFQVNGDGIFYLRAKHSKDAK